MDAVATHLRLARRVIGLSQKEASKAVGIGWRTLARYEAGETQPTTDVLSKLAAIYQRPVAWFFGDGPLDQAEEAAIRMSAETERPHSGEGDGAPALPNGAEA